MKINFYPLLFLFCLTWVACSSATEQEDPTAADENAPVREAFSVRFVFSEMADVKAALEAPHVLEMILDEENVQIFDRGVEMIFFNEEGIERSKLVADSAIFRNKFEDAEFWGNVVITTDEGKTIESKLLYYVKSDTSDIDTVWAPLMLKKPEPIYKFRKESLRAQTLPLDLVKSLDEKFKGKPADQVVETVRTDIDSLIRLQDKTPTDDLLLRILQGAMDTTFTQAIFNQVMVESDKEIIYGDSLWATTDFKGQRIHNVTGAVEMEEEL